MSTSDPGGLWVSFQSSALGTDIGDPRLYPDNHDVYEVVVTETEAVAPQVTVVRDQSGLKFLRDNQPKFVNVVWSPDDSVATSRRIFAGRIDEIPSDLFSETQTVTASAGMTSGKPPTLGVGKNTYGQHPYVNKLFSDFDEDDPDSYLVGVCGFYDVHPVSGTVEVSDYLVGKRIVDLVGKVLQDDGDRGRPRTVSTMEFGMPTLEINGKITLDWTRSCDGVVNLAGVVGTMSTLDPGVGQDLASRISIVDGDETGWRVGENMLVDAYTSVGDLGEHVPNVAQYRVQSQIGKDVQDYTTWASARLAVFRLTPRRIPIEFSYREDRKETLKLSCVIPMQPKGSLLGFAVDQDDVLEMSLKDPFEDSAIALWAPDVEYSKGDLVVYSGKLWRSREAHLSTSFDQSSSQFTTEQTGGSGSPIEYRVYKPMWQEVGLDDSTFTPLSASFWRSDLGIACAEHAALRLAKEGRKRLRALRLEFVVAWADGVGLSCRDSVRFEIWNGELYQRVVGKVVSLVKRWPMGDSPEAPTVTVQVGVSIGTADRTTGSSYFADRYTMTAYTAGQAAIGGVRPQNLSGIAAEIRKDLPFRGPTDPTRLADPSYAILSGAVRGLSGSQGNTARAIAAAGGDIRKCTSVNPTRLILKMRELAVDTEGDVAEQVYTAAFALTNSPMGIDIDGGDV